MTIRVTGGQFRGRRIESPPRSKEIRPTTALMRESVFGMLQQHVVGARFLDLFSGSGIMGIEAVSRGADFVLAIEKDRREVQHIRQQYASLGVLETQGKVVAFDVVELLRRRNREAPFDVVFVDPPYGFSRLPALVQDLQANGWVCPDGVILVEHGSREPDLPGFTRRLYGDSTLSVRTLVVGDVSGGGG